MDFRAPGTKKDPRKIHLGGLVFRTTHSTPPAGGRLDPRQFTVAVDTVLRGALAGWLRWIQLHCFIFPKIWDFTVAVDISTVLFTLAQGSSPFPTPRGHPPPYPQGSSPSLLSGVPVRCATLTDRQIGRIDR